MWRCGTMCRFLLLNARPGRNLCALWLRRYLDDVNKIEYLYLYRFSVKKGIFPTLYNLQQCSTFRLHSMNWHRQNKNIMKTRQYVSFDWAIKRLLRSKANFGVLAGFLSELLKENITILEVLESESNKDFKKHKQNIVDLKVKNSKDEIVIIEVQYDRDYSFFHRILWGTSRVVTEHLYEGDDYLRVHKVISVNLIYFDLGEGEDYIYHGSTSFRGIHKNDVLQLRANEKKDVDKDSVQHIFPEYYLVKINRFDDLAKDTLDEWIYFLKHEEIKPEFTAQGLQEAGRILAYTKLKEEDQIDYNDYIDNRRRRDSELRTQFSDGLEKGLEEGLEKGLEKGLEQGLEKGKRETALSMKKEGIPAELIQKCTKLSLDEINKL